MWGGGRPELDLLDNDTQSALMLGAYVRARAPTDGHTDRTHRTGTQMGEQSTEKRTDYTRRLPAKCVCRFFSLGLLSSRYIALRCVASPRSLLAVSVRERLAAVRQGAGGGQRLAGPARARVRARRLGRRVRTHRRRGVPPRQRYGTHTCARVYMRMRRVLGVLGLPQSLVFDSRVCLFFIGSQPSFIRTYLLFPRVVSFLFSSAGAQDFQHEDDSTCVYWAAHHGTCRVICFLLVYLVLHCFVLHCSIALLVTCTHPRAAVHAYACTCSND